MSLIVQENVPLAEFTTFKIGGKARFVVSAQSENEVVEALEFAEQNNLKIFILGGGSNVLIADNGFDGLVLQIALKGVSTTQKNDETVFITAQAGEDWDKFVRSCVEKNLAGLECLSGIPGFVGGTPVQNVGAYGQEVSETIVSVRCFDRIAKKIVELTNAECGFAYRTSIFNTAEKNRYIVLGVTYALKFGGEPKIVYRDLQQFFAEQTKTRLSDTNRQCADVPFTKPTLQESREAVLKIRAAKSMVFDPQDPNSKSAGSFFKNPVVDLRKFSEINAKARTLGIIGDGENVPKFVVDENFVKIPAAWLIE